MHLRDYDPEIFDDDDFYHQVRSFKLSPEKQGKFCQIKRLLLCISLTVNSDVKSEVNCQNVLCFSFSQLLREFIEQKTSGSTGNPIEMGRYVTPQPHQTMFEWHLELF